MIIETRCDYNRSYTSICLARLKTREEIKYLIFNEDYTNLIIVKKYLLKIFNDEEYYLQNVFELTVEDSDWITKNNVSGYKFIIENDIFNLVNGGADISKDVMMQCLKLQKTAVVGEWTNIFSDDDIMDMMNACNYFRDANLETIYNKEDNVIIQFNTTWESRLQISVPKLGTKIYFEDNGLNFPVGGIKVQFLQDNSIAWVNFLFTERDVEKIIENNLSSYIVAKSFKWRLLVDDVSEKDWLKNKE